MGALHRPDPACLLGVAPVTSAIAGFLWHYVAMSETTEGPTKVTLIPDGPLMVTGDVEICDNDGNVLRTASKISLCRCGHSEIKPYCDGAHKRNNFKTE